MNMTGRMCASCSTCMSTFYAAFVYVHGQNSNYGGGGTYEIAKHSVVSKEEMGGILFGGAIVVLYSMYSVHGHALCRLEP